MPCNFTDETTNVTIENVITPVSFRSDKFLLYGSLRVCDSCMFLTRNDVRYGDMIINQDYHTGVLFSLDFEHLHPRECVGADTPGTVGSDFEEWEVSNGSVCTMGMHTKYC